MSHHSNSLSPGGIGSGVRGELLRLSSPWDRLHELNIQNRFFTTKGQPFVTLALAIVALCHAFVALPLQAEPGVPGDGEGPPPKTPIHVIADKLEAVQSSGWVDFIGNVKAIQADVVMIADRMRIFYKLGEDSAMKEGTISKIVSEGHVKIVFDKETKTAEAEKATYIADQQVLVLSGGEPKVYSGKNVVQGKKITLFYAEKRSVVEGAGQEQVKATLFVKEGNGLMK